MMLDEIMGRGRDAKTMLAALNPNEARLMTLSPLAHPLYRTVIGYYLDAIKQLRKENLRQFRQLLSRGTQERRDADRRRYAGDI